MEDFDAPTAICLVLLTWTIAAFVTALLKESEGKRPAPARAGCPPHTWYITEVKPGQKALMRCRRCPTFIGPTDEFGRPNPNNRSSDEF